MKPFEKMSRSGGGLWFAGEFQREHWRHFWLNLLRRSAKNIRPEKTFFLLAVGVICFLLLKSATYKSLLKPAELAQSRATDVSTELKSKRQYVGRGRGADDGKWISMSYPFELHAYSAFLDSRWSLSKETGGHGVRRVVVIAFSYQLKRIRHCRVFFKRNSLQETGTLVKATVLHDYVVICRLPPRTSSRPERPVAVKLAWGKAINETTSFRIAVEIFVPDKNVANLSGIQWNGRGRLGACVTRMYGKVFEPRHVIEWIEMQRLLGVEKVVMYNHSVAEDVGRILAHYSRPKSTTVGRDTRSDFEVELRQTWPFDRDRPGDWGDEPHRHTMPGITDCYYRLINRFRYVVVLDPDEFVVPRSHNFTTITQIIEHVTDGGRLRPASLYFRNAYFFQDLLEHKPDNKLQSAGRFRGESVNTSMSYYSSHKLRWNTSPVGYVRKAVIDADGCVTLHVHGCQVTTNAFQTAFSEEIEATGRAHPHPLYYVDKNVPESIGLMHHYRRCCHLDLWHGEGYCKAQPIIVDDTVSMKYVHGVRSHSVNRNIRIVRLVSKPKL